MLTEYDHAFGEVYFKFTDEPFDLRRKFIDRLKQDIPWNCRDYNKTTGRWHIRGYDNIATFDWLVDYYITKKLARMARERAEKNNQ